MDVLLGTSKPWWCSLTILRYRRLLPSGFIFGQTEKPVDSTDEVIDRYLKGAERFGDSHRCRVDADDYSMCAHVTAASRMRWLAEAN